MRGIFVACFTASVAACSSGGTEIVPDSRIQPDTATVAGSLLQLVVNKITLPTRVEEHALDVDGNGTQDNQLGAIQGAVATLPLGPYDFQSNINRTLAEGGFLLLMDLHGRSLADDPKVYLDGLMGVDLDSPPNPADNFSGSESLAVSSTGPKGLRLDGVIKGGQLTAGPGVLVVPLPARAGTTSQTVTLEHAQLTAAVTASGLSNGQMNGGIPFTEVDQKFLPMVAAELTTVLQDPKTVTTVFDAITLAFDPSKDRTVTADELRQSSVLKLVLKPDLDLDGDKTPDALSVGMAFTAVPCTIKR